MERDGMEREVMAPAALAGLEYLLGLRPAADADAGDREGRGRAAVAAWFRLSPRTRALIAGLWPPGDPLSQWLKRHALAGPPGQPAAGAMAAALERNPDHVRALSALARLHFESGAYEAAKEAW